MSDARRALRGLELTVLRRLDGMLQGDYTGLLPGHGSEPGEARRYEPGDDVRRIDWNLTARTAEPWVRDTVADRELETVLVVDLSGSMAFGTARATKREVAVAAAAAFGFLSQRGGNRIGAMALDGRGGGWVPPRPGRRHLEAAVLRLLAAEGGGVVDLVDGLRRVDRAARRRGLVVVASDFLDRGRWERSLRALARRHDVVAVEVVDPRELELPRVGTVVLTDAETGRQRRIDTGAVAAPFVEAASRLRGDIRRRILGAGCDHLRLRTDRDWLVDLVHHVGRRRRAQLTGRRP